MSREIKFRAWKYRNGKMYQVTNMSFKKNWLGVNGEDSIGINYFNGDPNEYDFELMQYTGLKDKNGVEIYEGDIVVEEQEYDIDPYKFKVVYEHNGFWLEGRDNEYGFGDESDMKVIGNIYENGHLLEQS